MLVRRVVSGDSFYLENNTLVRLKDVRAPYLEQPAGKSSLESLRQLIEGKEVTLSYSNGQAVVFVNGTDVNLKQIEKGFALVAPGANVGQNYIDAQFAARDNKLGFWSYADKEYPWDFAKRVGKTEAQLPTGLFPVQIDPELQEALSTLLGNDSTSSLLGLNAVALGLEGSGGSGQLAVERQGGGGQVLRRSGQVNANRAPLQELRDAKDPGQRRQRNSDARKLDRFVITYSKGRQNQKTHYYFTMLPAIENVFRGSGQNVPDVKPGIMFTTEENYVRHLIPGAPPVYQSMGIKGKSLFLVGAFLGFEKTNQGGKVGNRGGDRLDVKYDGNPVTAAQLNSYETAKLFDEEVLQSGKPIKLDIYSVSDKHDEELNIQVNGLVESMRVYTVRADRTYYAIAISCLDFNWGRVGGAETNTSNDPSQNPFSEPYDNYDRGEPAKDLDGKIQLDEAQIALRKAREQFESARRQLTEAQTKARNSGNAIDLESAKRALDEAQIGLRNARSQMERAVRNLSVQQTNLRRTRTAPRTTRPGAGSESFSNR